MDKKTSTYSYAKTSAPAPKKNQKAQETMKMVEQLTQATASANSKVGVDVESLSALNIDNETFIERNFTGKEIAYCQKAPNPQASFTGKWSAKEAVFKSLGVKGQGAGAALKDIEIVNDESGAPSVQVCLLLRPLERKQMLT
jgi:fatty acid synthase subunit alpha